MNKLTKIGCSALCGSLSAISAANAGDLSVTGGADLTFSSLSSQVTGNPIGMGSNYTLKGNGELDNGWAFSLSIANTNANAYSATTLNLDMGGLGSLNLDQGSSANGIQAFDDVLPTAWEEPWGAGLSTGIRLVSGIGKSMNVQYTAPTVLGTTFAIAMAPDMGAADTADKGTSGDSTGGFGHGVDFRFKTNASLGTEILSGLNLYAGGHMRETRNNNSTTENDTFEAVGAVTYALGPVELGWQLSGEYLGEENTHAYNAYKNHALRD